MLDLHAHILKEEKAAVFNYLTIVRLVHLLLSLLCCTPTHTKICTDEATSSLTDELL